MFSEALDERIRRLIPSRKTINKARSMVRHHRRAQKEDRSFAGEYAHLKYLVSKLGISRGFVVDIGASDGVNFSCTLGFFRKPEWSGLAVEYDKNKFAALTFVYSEFTNTQLALSRVTPNTAPKLLQAHDVPEQFTLLNLDIDSYDLPVMASLLESGYRPEIITIEINELIPPPIYFTVEYSDDFEFVDNGLAGCSLVAAAETIKPYGYRLESLQYNNAMFVLDDICGDLIEDLDVKTAYDEGFRNKPDRAELFHWHVDMDSVLNDTPENALIRLAERCPKRGEYTLRLSDTGN